MRLRWSLAGVLVAAIAGLAGCGRFFEEREAWRREAELACLQSGMVKSGPAVEEIRPISGPGVCGADFPLNVMAFTEPPSLGFSGDLRPPGALPVHSQNPYATPRASYQPPAVPLRPSYAAPLPPAALSPPATLACPIVSALDQWMLGAVQPAAQRWFGQGVIEIKQISAYSCRPMNNQRGARISEHAFGNALDIAAFTLADGREVNVRQGWRGLPEEQAFLRDVHAAACERFSTVLGPGADMFHYDHLHLDLARRDSGRAICKPFAVSGDTIAAQQRPPIVTGSARYGHESGAERRSRFGGSLRSATPGED